MLFSKLQTDTKQTFYYNVSLLIQKRESPAIFSPSRNLLQYANSSKALGLLIPNHLIIELYTKYVRQSKHSRHTFHPVLLHTSGSSWTSFAWNGFLDRLHRLRERKKNAIIKRTSTSIMWSFEGHVTAGKSEKRNGHLISPFSFLLSNRTLPWRTPKLDQNVHYLFPFLFDWRHSLISQEYWNKRRKLIIGKCLKHDQPLLQLLTSIYKK